MSASTCCPVVELRQYTLVPGERETLIALFEREFVESQEATGITLIGQFRDLQNPDRFVWLRGFSDMAARAQQLQAFYGGPIWKANRDAANATMIDSDDVLLLRPARPDSGFPIRDVTRSPVGSTAKSEGLFAATIYHRARATGAEFADFFARDLEPKILKTGGSVLATLVTENHPNTFPALPVREDANVFICFSPFPDRASYDRHAAALADSLGENEVGKKLGGLIVRQPETLLLAPTARSLLRG